MIKIKEILVGTNNQGKYKEICDLLPDEIEKYSPKEFKISSPQETGKSFEENSIIKASYFSKKTNLVCLSDDSGLEIELLKGAPGIYSARWGGKNGFGYDPIFIPDGFDQTFGEMKPKLKMSIDHRFKAFLKIKELFN